MNYSELKILDKLREKGFIQLFLSNSLMYLTGFLASFFAAYILPPADIGRLKFLQVLLMVGGIIGGLGTSTAIEKLCSEQREQGEKKYLLGKAIKYTLISTVVFYFIISLVSLFDVFSNDSIINNLIPLFLLSLVPSTLVTLIQTYFTATKRFKQLSYIQNLTKFLQFILIVLLTYFFFLHGYIYGFIAGFYITFIAFYIFISVIEKNTIATPLKNPFRIQWNLGKYSILINLLTVFLLNMDIIIINYMHIDRTGIGFYSFAATLTVSLYLVTTTIQQITTPYFSERSGNPAEWYSFYKRYNKYLNLIFFALFILAVVLSPFIISLLFSGKYDSSIFFFQMLAIGWMIRNLYTLKMVAMFGLGEIKYNYITFQISFPVTLIGSLILINIFGLNGAVYSNIFTGLVTLLVAAFFFHKLLKKYNLR